MPEQCILYTAIAAVVIVVFLIIRSSNKRKEQQRQAENELKRKRAADKMTRVLNASRIPADYKRSRRHDDFDEGEDLLDVALTAAVVADVLDVEETYADETFQSHENVQKEVEPELTDEQMEQNVRDAIANSTPVQESTSIPEPTPTYSEPERTSYSSPSYDSGSSSYDSGSSDSGGSFD